MHTKQDLYQSQTPSPSAPSEPKPLDVTSKLDAIVVDLLGQNDPSDEVTVVVLQVLQELLRRTDHLTIAQGIARDFLATDTALRAAVAKFQPGMTGFDPPQPGDDCIDDPEPPK